MARLQDLRAFRFVQACLTRFVEVQGIDRGVALGAQAFTALLPLLIVYGSIVQRRDGEQFASDLADRLGLSGTSELSLEQAFTPPVSASSSTSILGVVLLLLSALSFTRALQRLYETSYGVPSLGMRGSKYGLQWLAAVGVFTLVRPLLVHNTSGRLQVVVVLATSTVLWLGTPYLLLGQRLAKQRLLPGAVLCAVLMTSLATASALFLPRTVATSSQQFGIIGVAFALMSWFVFAGWALCVSASTGAVFDRWRQDARPPATAAPVSAPAS